MKGQRIRDIIEFNQPEDGICDVIDCNNLANNLLDNNKYNPDNIESSFEICDECLREFFVVEGEK